MCLLFVGGVMNIAWIAGIAIWVLIEKTLPSNMRLGPVSGVTLISVALIQLATALALR